jgi:hypothetical protein
LPAREASGADANSEIANPEGWNIINTLLRGLAEIPRGAASATGEPDRSPDTLGDAIARALETAGQHREAAVLRQQLAAPPVGAGTGERAQLAPSSQDRLEPLRRELQRELDAFLGERGLTTPATLLEDPALAEPRRELSGRLLRVLANAMPLLSAAQADGGSPPSSREPG